MCTKYLHYFHHSSPFTHLLPPSHCYHPFPGRICSALLFSDFV
jgi:hypothetical protein